MRPHNAPAWDRAWRDNFPPQVRAAMATLDRVSVGEHVPAHLVDHALAVTGDIHESRLSRHETLRTAQPTGA